MIRPISGINNNYRCKFNFKSSNTISNTPDTYTQTLLQQNEKRNQLIQKGVNTASVGLAVIALIELGKAAFGKPSSNITTKPVVKEPIKELFKEFETLGANDKIPTLDNCKSLDNKMREFLKTQLQYSKASEEDLKLTGHSKPANRLILFGAPGTGKSYFAKIYAKTMGAEYTEVLFSDFNSKWAGEGTEKLKKIFETILAKAKKSPNNKFVVTFNEIDTIVQPAEKLTGSGGGGSYWVSKLEQRSTFLNYIDRLSEEAPNVTVIGTTNLSPKNKNLDSASMSRFKNIIEVPYPDKNCLFEALKSGLKDINGSEIFIENNKNEIQTLAKQMEEKKSSYRDLNNIIEKSKEYYLEDYLSDRNSKFKIDYLKKAQQESLTDGELAGVV